jgi:hypothetical protein
VRLSVSISRNLDPVRMIVDNDTAFRVMIW